MSLKKLRSSFRSKLNSSFSNEQEADSSDYIHKIKQLKENSEANQTPRKLYQKIASQYRANLKNRRLADAMSSNKDGAAKVDFYGSMDVLNILRESDRSNESKHHLTTKYQRDDYYENKESLRQSSMQVQELKYTTDLGVQTTPKQEASTEELTKMKIEFENQSKVVQIMEQDLSKIRIENIKLDKAFKTAQESLSVLGKVTVLLFFIC